LFPAHPYHNNERTLSEKLQSSKLFCPPPPKRVITIVKVVLLGFLFFSLPVTIPEMFSRRNEGMWLQCSSMFEVHPGPSPTFFFFCVWWRARSRSYGRTAALRLIVQPCDEDD
jgi:hypothetical protein